MGLLDAQRTAGPAPDANARAAQALDSMMLKQIFTSSGAFKGSSAAGSSLHSELFIEALSDAVAKQGGLGLGKLALPQGLPTAPPTGHHLGDLPALTIQALRSPAAHLGGPAASHSASNRPPSDLPTAGPAAEAAPAAQVAAEDADLPVTLSAPLASSRTTSSYGLRSDPFDGHTALHSGLDLAAPEGESITAAAAGTVKRAGRRGGYGKAVEIDHGNGVTTLYAHASTLSVKPGDHVEAGEQIGEVGSTGHATGAHLHFELRQDGRAIDPRPALKAYAERAEEEMEWRGQGNAP